MFKIFIVTLIAALACTLLYAMVQSLDPSFHMTPPTPEAECEVTKEPILVALNGMI